MFHQNSLLNGLDQKEWCKQMKAPSDEGGGLAILFICGKSFAKD
jgi:hypothetical protein